MGYFSKLSAGTAEKPIPAIRETAGPSDVRPAPTPQATAPSQTPPQAEPAPSAHTPPPPEVKLAVTQDAAQAPDDAAARQAHEAAEAKRKADWDAKQAEKQAEQQAALDKLAAMSDAEVIQASTKRVGDDVERLTRRSMKEQVAGHIQNLCRRDPAFARRAMLPGKSMAHCFWYINRRAKEFMEREIKDADPNPASGIYGSDVPDDLVFQWAVDYFDDDDAPEDRKNEEKFTPKPYVPKSGTKSGKKADTKKESKPKSVSKPKGQSGVDGQISLLGAAV